MKHIFIITFNGIDVLNKWFNPLDYPKNYTFHIIDNGNQRVPKKLIPYMLHTCKENIFCAGAWNLALQIGFDYFDQDKVIVTEDDLVFNKDVIDKCFDLCNETTIAGGRPDQFFYSFYCMHKDTFEKVGNFDENCLFVTCEDNDYIYRAGLAGISHASAKYNLPDKHLCSSIMSYKFKNKEYIEQKWNGFTSKTPLNTCKFRPNYWSCFCKEYCEFMSTIEYRKFIENIQSTR